MENQKIEEFVQLFSRYYKGIPEGSPVENEAAISSFEKRVKGVVPPVLRELLISYGRISLGDFCTCLAIELEAGYEEFIKICEDTSEDGIELKSQLFPFSKGDTFTGYYLIGKDPVNVSHIYSYDADSCEIAYTGPGIGGFFEEILFKILVSQEIEYDTEDIDWLQELRSAIEDFNTVPIPERLQQFWETEEYKKYWGCIVPVVPCCPDNSIHINLSNKQDLSFAEDWLACSDAVPEEECDSDEIPLIHDNIRVLASCFNNMTEEDDEDDPEWETAEDIFFVVDISKKECPVGFCFEGPIYKISNSFDEFLSSLKPCDSSELSALCEDIEEEFLENEY